MRTLALVFLVACAPRPEPLAPNPIAEPAPTVTAADPLAVYAGHYTLGPSSAPNECGDKLYLAAKHIDVDPPSSRMFADVVDRTYAARVSEGTLIAEGRFNVPGICPGTQVYEKWRLTRDASGSLTGDLESHWSLPPYCQRACVVTFPITATPG